MATVPFIFVNNTQIADANQVNANFAALVSAINALTIGSFIIYLTVAALRAVATIPPANQVAMLSGYYQAGDRPPAFYMFDVASVLADNGGTVIRPTIISSGNPGRWILTGQTT